MPSQFLRYERVAVDTVNRMYGLIDKADSFPGQSEYLVEAATIGCNTLQRLTIDAEFYDDLIVPYMRRDAPSPVQRPDLLQEWERLRDDMNELDRFLKIEHEVLLNAGMEPGAADILIARCRGVTHIQVSQNEVQGAVMDAFGRLQEEACGEAAALRRRRADAADALQMEIADAARRRQTRGILGRVFRAVGGAAFVGLNGGLFAVTAGLSAVGSAASIQLGLGLILIGAA